MNTIQVINKLEKKAEEMYLQIYDLKKIPRSMRDNFRTFKFGFISLGLSIYEEHEIYQQDTILRKVKNYVTRIISKTNDGRN